MKQYKVKKFSSEARGAHVSDDMLKETIKHFLNLDQKGQQKYSLGGNVYKLRLATNEGQGKSGGSRSIFAIKKDSLMIWLHLFQKNDKDNVTHNELKKLKSLADVLLNLSVEKISKLLLQGELIEVEENE